MMAHPLALQLRNLQSLVEIGVDKNTTFPAPLMSTIGELGAFLAAGEHSRGRPATDIGHPGHLAARTDTQPKASRCHGPVETARACTPTGVQARGHRTGPR